MILTYKFRLRDTAASELSRQASAVNFVWNYCNETQKKAARDGRKWLSKYDLQKLTSNSSKHLNIHSDSIQRVCWEYANKAKQHKRPWLKWRSKKSLGWVPFKSVNISFDGECFVFRKKRYKAWVTRDLQKIAKFKSGSFNQDARGRWYINLAVESEHL